jgi:hypothetical protein
MLAQLKNGKNIMNLLPDKNLFIVTSALKPTVGVIPEDDRFTQTIHTLRSLRFHVPDAILLFSDGSPNEVEQEKYQEIAKYVNGIIPWNLDDDIQRLGREGAKSLTEAVMMLKMLIALKQNPELAKMMSEVKRVFKYSARTVLHDEFKIEDYDNLFGKYVFKKRIPTWMQDQRKEVVDHLYITRMFSFCPSLLDNYIIALQNIIQSIQQYGLDTEHAHFHAIDKQYVVEFDKLHCQGIMAQNGAIEDY